MKPNTLCFRLTVMTGAILLLCSIALTVSASLNARKQLTAVAVSASLAEPTEAVLIPSRVVVADDVTLPVGIASVTTARRSFDLAGITALFIISVLGTGAVYVATRYALKPIRDLNEQIASITKNDLDVRVSEPRRADEVGILCRSFNVMLERLSDSFSAQKQFSANVAHELRTPLATMQASVQVLRLDEAPAKDDCLRMLDVVERNTDRLCAVIDDLMHLCNEQDEFEKSEISLSKLFAGIFSELDPMLGEKHIQTEIDCEGYPVVIGNEGLLYRAFFNLVENAAKYGRKGGKIQVTSSCEGTLGIIRVSDTGFGIPQEHLSHIFEPFYRVSKSRSRKLGGAGLGLSVVKTIIERHGWSISVDSAVDVGTEFEIRLYKS